MFYVEIKWEYFYRIEKYGILKSVIIMGTKLSLKKEGRSDLFRTKTYW